MNALTGKGPLGQKVKPAVSKAIRDAAKGEDCTLRLEGCQNDTETTVFAHFRQLNTAGMGQKPPDFWGAFACAHCHEIQERNGRIGGDLWGFDDLYLALFRTQSRLFELGLLKVK